MSVQTNKLSSGHSVEYYSEEENEAYRKNFDVGRDCRMIRLKPGGYVHPEYFLTFAKRFYNFKFRPNDVVVMTPLKCGTTWALEIVWSLLYNKNLDNSDAATAVNLRASFLGIDGMTRDVKFLVSPENDSEGEVMTHFHKICPGLSVHDGIMLQTAENSSSPRVLKSHNPFSVLNPSLLETCKVVFVARNPKDTCLSLYYFWRLMVHHSYNGTLDDFVKLFLTDNIYYLPYWSMIKEGWARKSHPNMLFLYYENMKADSLKEISKIDQFLQTNLSESQLQKINDYTSFEQMKKRNNFIAGNDSDSTVFKKEVMKETGGFFRKGLVGESENVFTKDQLQMFDEWTALNTTGMQGFKYATIK